MRPDDLYGLALDRFVPERAALVKALRASGRRDEAAEVGNLRKPSVAAWAVNQLIRSQARDVQALFEAGDALRDAQAQLLAGSGDGRALRAAGEQERAAVDRLVDTARGLLSSEGSDLSSLIIERVADTLHAAALDEAAREQVREGRLARELRHVGLGLGESAATAPAPAPAQRAPAGKKRPAGTSSAAQGAGKRAARQRAEAERVRHARKAARVAEATARRAVQRAARALRAAEKQREQAADELREADEALAAAREDAAVADAALRRAQADLEKA